MNYEEFKNLYGDTDYNNVISRGVFGKLDSVSCTWMTGGAWGGNCWDNRDPSSCCPEAEHEPTEWGLDTIINAHWPDISFMNYKNKLIPLIQYDTQRTREYYGNYTDRAIKRINLRELFDLLVEHGKITT